MQREQHSWHSIRAAYGRRASLGLLAALTLTLVAFEWKSRTVTLDPWLERLPEEDHWELPPVVILEPERKVAAEKPKTRARTTAPVAGPPEPDPDPAEDPTTEPDDGLPMGAGNDPPEPTIGQRPELIDDPVMPWDGVEQRPYFMDCLKRSPGTLDACTEARIEQHLRRHFKVPPGMREKVYTMVTFEIDKQGRIGRLACTPKPHAAVEREVERVLRMLPEFVPASQSGHPVSVYFRIPLSVQVR